MRPVTRIILIVLFVILLVAGIAQFTMGGPDLPYPGPISGTPYPPVSTSP